MDQEIRNKLRNVVTRCRKLLEESIAHQLQGQFGIYAGKKGTVHVEEDSRMSHLSEEDKQYRRDVLDHFKHIKARGFKPNDALDQLIREIAFTHLNRLCAYKMMEAREVYVGGQKFREAVSRGINSNGFKFYLADHPDDERLFNTGQQEVAYRHYLDWLGGQLSEEIGVLFNPNDPANRLYPPQRVLDQVLDLLNTGGIGPDDAELREAWPTIWSEDETIGWVYQYFTPKELRDAARDPKRGGSQAPRNSYELAFRNQFFTPRYVVEFLTDNTLGRIWYEMRMGDTKLKEQCRYMVRRPNEIFLEEGQDPPETPEAQDNLSQEELLQQPVHIPHRPKKDPRELKILDPACGSGHFLLYCFDLLLTIYEEAWDDPDLGPPLQQDYATLDDLRRDVPRLILAHNLHGIDIDLRCTQIAALALWLRCQRAYQKMQIKKERPKITRSNLVCAEPMPGEEGLLKEFLNTLHKDRLPKLIRRVMDVPEDKPVRATPEMADRLCELVRLVWDRMTLAGEAGSLLKIEEELQEAIRKGQEKWEEDQPLFRVTQYALTEEPQEKYVRFVPGEGVSFWERAEALVMAALDDFAKYAANGRKLLRRLFVDDAMRGFAFVDVCRQRFDVVVMNPPFGDTSERVSHLLSTLIPLSKKNTYIASIVLGLSRLAPNGLLGAITDATFIHQTRYQEFRRLLLDTEKCSLASLVALGWEVLDSYVETACYIVSLGSTDTTLFVDLRDDGNERYASLRSVSEATREGRHSPRHFFLPADTFNALPKNILSFWLPAKILRAYHLRPPLDPEFVDARCGLSSSDNPRFYKLRWEIPPSNLSRHKRWSFLSNGGAPSPLFRQHCYVIDFENEGAVIRERVKRLFGSETRTVINSQYYFRPGLTYGKQTESITVQFMPEGFVFSNEGQAIFRHSPDQMWGVLAYLNTSVIAWLLNSIAGQHKEAGYVGSIPAPSEQFIGNKGVVEATKDNYSLLARLSQALPESQLFVSPFAVTSDVASSSLRSIASQFFVEEKSFSQRFCEIDTLAEEDFGYFRSETAPWAHRHWDIASVLFEATKDEVPRIVTHDIIAYAVGTLFGRWDFRFMTGQKAVPALPGPLDRLPVSVPGALDGNSVEQLTPPPTDYPLDIDWDGMLVDDPGNQDDIVRRVRDVLEVIWKDRADAIEKESCEILDVKTLRDYFRKPSKGGFWDDHVKRYSKSRRKAPIYWLLQSSKKNYALWLYYHRLDKDMLFKALLNYVEPRIQREENRLAELRSQKSSAGDSGKEAKKLDREAEKQEDLLSELRDFEEKLRRAANLHIEPDLNDGVVLNIAPLHELVPWKEAGKYWDELLEGKYEWSSIGKQLREKGLVQ